MFSQTMLGQIERRGHDKDQDGILASILNESGIHIKYGY